VFSQGSGSWPRYQTLQYLRHPAAVGMGQSKSTGEIARSGSVNKSAAGQTQAPAFNLYSRIQLDQYWANDMMGVNWIVQALRRITE